jgi:hypothetical protein
MWMLVANRQLDLGGRGGSRATPEVVGARGANPVTIRGYWQKLVTTKKIVFSDLAKLQGQKFKLPRRKFLFDLATLQGKKKIKN